MKLHIMYPSANSHGPMVVAKRLGLDNIEFVDAYGKTCEESFVKLNPCHCAPMLELDDGQSAIWESNAVMKYLCSLAEDKGSEMYPSDPIKRAKLDMAMDWRQTLWIDCIRPIGYILWGYPFTDEQAKEKGKQLFEEQMKVLMDHYLKDTEFVFSDTPTIADLAIACPMAFIKVRGKFWEAVPQKAKDYHQRVMEAFPEGKEWFDMLNNMASSFDGAGADLEP